MSSLDYLDLCRLCLVKDRVSVPIFEGEGDVRQIFLKIAACLPVKVAREDKLPKKICDDCVYKVELFYQFWNTTANAEKQLLQWLGEVDIEDNVSGVLNTDVMKQEQSGENRLDGTVMQQVSSHQNNMGIGIMDNMGLGMPIIMSSNNQQQITSVPMDTSGSSVQLVQAVPGPSSQTSQDQANTSRHQDEEEDESEEEDNSDDECDGDQGLPVKEESEDDPGTSGRTLEPTTFVNVSVPCDEAGPSGLQQQKIVEMPEIAIPQTTDGDPKSGPNLRDYLKAKATLRICVTVKQTHAEEATGAIKATSRQLTPIENLLGEDQGSTAYRTKSVLGEHKKTHEKKKKFRCIVCSLILPLRSELRSHLEMVHGITTNYTCPDCGEAFKDRQNLKQHRVEKHAENQIFRCANCGKKFKDKADLQLHMLAAHRELRVTCTVCGMKFRNNFSLKRHVAEAHNKRRFPCDHCNQILTWQESKLHIKKSEVCEYCGRMFLSSESLRTHMAFHRPVEKFHCSFCGKTFITESAFKQHLLVHSNIKPYVCEVCGQSFKQKQGLYIHQKKHPGSWPAIPTVCIDEVVKDLLEESLRQMEK